MTVASPVRIIEVGETGSTNADAMARALDGEPLPFWLAAKRQTAGKGRLGRAWLSEPGNLHASLALHLHCSADKASQLSLVSGVAVMDAIRQLNPPGMESGVDALRLKWPNDIVAEDAKCGGILIESASNPSTMERIAVIGVGLNLVSHPEIEGRIATHLSALGAYAPPMSYLSAIAGAMEKVLEVWSDGQGFEEIVRRWLTAATPVGTKMSINTGTARVAGAFAGLDPDGALLMKDSVGRLQRFTFGDVELQSSITT